MMPGLDDTRKFVPLALAVLTVSDTRVRDNDRSGDRLVELLTRDGHHLAARDIVRDDIDAIVARLGAWLERADIDVILTTGGTGVTGRDVTPEALKIIGEKDIPGFGELFRWLSFQKIGTSTIQSRAAAVVARGKYVFALPGSPGACLDAWEGILRYQLDNRFRPCNFAELIPRLIE